jgi:hypothetical protein
MNFYAKGQSVGRINPGRKGSNPTLEIHQKYLSGGGKGAETDRGQRYEKLSQDEGWHEGKGRSRWQSGMLRAWIRRAETYAGDEKKHIDELIGGSPKIIDLEMGLPAYDARRIAPRMDIVALEEVGDAARLVFWEAKMENDSRLRSEAVPEVFQQIANYVEYLSDEKRREAVGQAYRRNCELLVRLGEMVPSSSSCPALDPLVVKVATGAVPLEVDVTPRLVIFETGRKRDDCAWKKHLEELRSGASPEKPPRDTPGISVAVIPPSKAGTVPLEKLPRSGG